MSLTAELADTRARLEPLVGDAGRLTQLEETITVLAETVGPLQGASERIGRLVDRLPAARGGGRGQPRDDAEPR